MTHLIRLHDFNGGIHPPENKHQSTQRPIRAASLPAQLILPLHQHIGAAALAEVAPGERVLKGQRIAQADGTISVPVHAPTSGHVVAIEPRPVPHASGLEELCIVIEPDGEEQWQPRSSLLEQLGVDAVQDIEPPQLVDFIRDMGIAGMGGAGFPTAAKLQTRRFPIHTLILNGAECEPYITADDMLMRERAAEVISGAEILQHIVSSERCLIGVEDNKPEAIAALQQALSERNLQHQIDLVVIPTKYPSGGEKQLIQILTGEEVPSGGIPAHIGVVCQNVGTASAIHRAVYHAEPLISRITTVTGEACREPGNWDTLIGTPVSHLLTLSGYQPQTQERVIMGGPMMGFALPHAQLPIVKTSNCLLTPTASELPSNDLAMACIRCGMCADACPAELLPQQLYWFSKAQEFDKAEQHNLFDCIECGACSYVCPSHIPLVQYYRFAKGAIREERAAQAKSERAKERFENRLARQEREQAEKDAKRKARAEAAAKAKQSAAQQAPSTPTTASAATIASQAEGSAEALEKLNKKLTATQTAISKTQDKLAAARADESQADKIPALEAALEKTQDKLKQLAKDIAAAKKAAKAQPDNSDKGDPNSPERLKRKWETAQTRLQTAQQRLQEAQQQGLDTVAALQAGVDKQQQRVNEAHSAYEQALQAASSAPAEAQADASNHTASVAIDVEALQKKILAQQDRLSKAQERLQMAEADNLDTVPALSKGVDKQQQKLEQLQQQLQQATQQSTEQTPGA
ncbi:electron transport complex subunit RsxC [Bacterioplanes sanyensis]|uniref:Ion-translocating oxidoreductase complex subunit C n=1 Tax=Bacterioplanes sanyensis TaxID=1249553 RepID=A0A222FNK1_9GAMM|nr:electron transport complex subunit RsxC [Bacterioplanes sanyensis]ASP40136.1 electron transport complex subunit RsxC [Bacterioplanes sanyensis]